MSKPTCSIRECEQPTKSRGWCAKHYKRWERRRDLGDPEPPRPVPNQKGYLTQRMPDHPTANVQGRAYLHRVALWDRLDGREPECAFCHVRLVWGGTESNSVTVEHLDGDRTNNHPLNLVAACPSCNTKRARHQGCLSGETR